MDLSALQRDIAEVGAALTEGLERLQYGSYADRHPSLGKMRTCPHCHKRRFEFSEVRCCNAGHATSQRAYDVLHDVKGISSPRPDERGYGPTTRHEKGFYQEPCEPRVNKAMLPKKFMKQLMHKRHSNVKRHQIHDLALELQSEEFRNTTQLLLEGLPGFYEPIQSVAISSIPSYAERVLRTIRKSVARRKRKQQQLARRINFGLAAGKSGIRRKQ